MEIINELERTLIDHLNFILSLSDECIENSELRIRCEGDEDGQFLSWGLRLFRDRCLGSELHAFFGWVSKDYNEYLFKNRLKTWIAFPFKLEFNLILDVKQSIILEIFFTRYNWIYLIKRNIVHKIISDKYDINAKCQLYQ